MGKKIIKSNSKLLPKKKDGLNLEQGTIEVDDKITDEQLAKLKTTD